MGIPTQQTAHQYCLWFCDPAKWLDAARDLIRRTHRLYEYLLNLFIGQGLFCSSYEADTDPKTLRKIPANVGKNRVKKTGGNNGRFFYVVAGATPLPFNYMHENGTGANLKLAFS